MSDPINHPEYYTKHSVSLEPADLTGLLNSCIGQALQYLIRRKDKENEVQDIKKAIWWLNKFTQFAKETEHSLSITTDEFAQRVKVLVPLFMQRSNDEQVKNLLSIFNVHPYETCPYVGIENLRLFIQDLEDYLELKKDA